MATATELVEVPAPWKQMKAEAYTFVAWSNASHAPPSSAYDPLERSSSFADPESSGHFVGGLGNLMIVRYHDTPCGPYDELVYAPGEFQVPGSQNKKALRITRIYVSTVASTFNGRRNWNIPKRVANFTFTPRTDGYPGYERVEVRLPGAEKPFFAVQFTPSWLSFLKFPVNTAYLPPTKYAQPPLPKGEEDERVGTDKWQGIEPTMNGSMSFVWATGALEDGEWCDGVDMPPLPQVYTLGTYSDNFRMDFPASTDPFA